MRAGSNAPSHRNSRQSGPSAAHRDRVVERQRRRDGRYLHPKFVTALLNDLFGIQSRAGCSCAGPYGHQLLHIDVARSNRYREWVKKGFGGIKPGWCRDRFSLRDGRRRGELPHRRGGLRRGVRPSLHSAVSLRTRHPARGRTRSRAPQYEHLSLEAALRAGRVEPTARSAAERTRLYRAVSRRRASCARRRWRCPRPTTIRGSKANWVNCSFSR